MKQSKDPFEASLEEQEESPLNSPVVPEELESQSQNQTETATGELEDEFDNLSTPMSVSAVTNPNQAFAKNKEEDDEEEEENMDVDLAKFPSSADPAEMAKMQAILSQFTEDQMNQYESFGRSALQKSNMRRSVIC